MCDESETASLFDTFDRDHVVPGVDHTAHGECGNLKVETSHCFVFADVFVIHHYLKDVVGWVGEVEVEFLVPDRLHAIVDCAGFAGLVAGRDPKDAICVSFAKEVHFRYVDCLAYANVKDGLLHENENGVLSSSPIIDSILSAINRIFVR